MEQHEQHPGARDNMKEKNNIYKMTGWRPPEKTKQDGTNTQYMKDFLTSFQTENTIFTLKIWVISNNGDSSVFLGGALSVSSREFQIFNTQVIFNRKDEEKAHMSSGSAQKLQ